MRASLDRLVDGSEQRRRRGRRAPRRRARCWRSASAASGRRLVLGEFCEDEVEASLAVLPAGARRWASTPTARSRRTAASACELHNQTMTITTLSERPVHRLLARQLRKAGLTPGRPAPGRRRPGPACWRPSSGPTPQIDEGRYLMEQSMDTLSREMRELLRQPRGEPGRAIVPAPRRHGRGRASRPGGPASTCVAARGRRRSCDCESARVLRSPIADGPPSCAGAWVSAGPRGTAPQFSVSAPIRVDGVARGAP